MPLPPAVASARFAPLHLAAAALLLAAGLAFCLHGAGRSLWLDEAWSANAVAQPAAVMFRTLAADSHPPLYFLALRAWTGLTGESEAALRALAGLCALLAAVATGAAARAFGAGRGGTLFAALLCLAAKPAVAHAQNVRPYALLCLVCALLLFSFARLRAGRAGGRAAFGAVVALGCFVHYWFFFALAGLLLAIVFLRPREVGRLCLPVAVAAVPFSLLWLPVFLREQAGRRLEWLTAPGPAEAAATFAGFYGGGWPGALVFAALLGLPLLRRSEVRRDAAAAESARLCLLAAFLCLAIPFALSQIKPMYRAGSYTIAALPALAVGIALLYERFASRRLRNVCAAVLLVGSLGGFLRAQQDRLAGPSERDFARNLAAELAPGDEVVFTSLSRPPFEYYARRLPVAPVRRASFPAEIDAHPGWRNPAEQLAHPAGLEAEAEATARRLAAGPPGRRVWLAWGDPAVSGHLTARLDALLVREADRPWPGAFHDRVLVYRVPLR